MSKKIQYIWLVYIILSADNLIHVIQDLYTAIEHDCNASEYGQNYFTTC